MFSRGLVCRSDRYRKNLPARAKTGMSRSCAREKRSAVLAPAASMRNCRVHRLSMVYNDRAQLAGLRSARSGPPDWLGAPAMHRSVLQLDFPAHVLHTPSDVEG